MDVITTRFTNANVHRAAHALADEATQGIRRLARDKAASSLSMPTHREEIIFTSRHHRESSTWSRTALTPQRVRHRRCRILISELEHHSNIVPWQLLAARTGAEIIAARVTDAGDVDLDDFKAKLDPSPAIVAFGHVSNALGSVHPITEMIDAARAAGAITVIDGAQALAHLPVDVQALELRLLRRIRTQDVWADRHRACCTDRRELLNALPPWQGGGEMIEHVTLTGRDLQRAPLQVRGRHAQHCRRHRASAPPSSTSRELSWEDIRAAREPACSSARRVSELKQMPEVRLVGEPGGTRGRRCLSWSKAAIPHDIGTLLDQQGVAVRTGHHCTMPLMERLRRAGNRAGLFQSV